MANEVPPQSATNENIVLCFSHLRWHFVFQRPQHLLSRAGRRRHVYFFEEPVFVDEANPVSPHVSSPVAGVTIVVPFIPNQQRSEQVNIQRQIVADVISRHANADIAAWYYTPMALSFTEDLPVSVTVYDCMDELSGFLGAPPDLAKHEKTLFEKADLVFTGGRSLYEVKRKQHANVHAFPSSIDKAHFAPTRIKSRGEPADQASLLLPRIGFFGVIDERMNLQLVNELAALRPQWQFVLIGPVVKVDPGDLPRRHNLHWLGPKTYDELPAYLEGWDAAFMPFALNDATRFISPTKTPEFLTAGVPVVSTPIVDVVNAYGKFDVVGIANNAEDFAHALERQMSADKPARFAAVDAFLAQQSWDATWLAMERLIEEARLSKKRASISSVATATRAA